MNSTDLKTLYAYNAWANRRTLDSCAALDDERFTRDLSSSFPSVRDTLVHILGAEWIWLERWLGRSPTSFTAAGPFPDLPSVSRRWAEIEAALLGFVGGLSSETMEGVFAYRTMAGILYEEPMAHSLQHLANHSTYHRGQVATMLRQLGSKPAGTDMIAFYRQRAARVMV